MNDRKSLHNHSVVIGNVIEPQLNQTRTKYVYSNGN